LKTHWKNSSQCGVSTAFGGYISLLSQKTQSLLFRRRIPLVRRDGAEENTGKKMIALGLEVDGSITLLPIFEKGKGVS
jgi:hypothetical protein